MGLRRFSALAAPSTSLNLVTANRKDSSRLPFLVPILRSTRPHSKISFAYFDYREHKLLTMKER